MYTTASALLQAVYDDLKVPGRRCKGWYAKSKSGRAVSVNDRSAVAWTTTGKIIALTGSDENGHYRSVFRALHETRPIRSGIVETNNDDLDDTQWAAWMEAAIQYAKDQEAQ